MSNNIFNPMEIDAIGEIMNISLGSSATAVSNMLNHRVDITTPKVTVVNAEEFSLGNIEPAIGVEIKYITGLEGSNIMVLKVSDIRIIVDILTGMETPEEEFELNELTLSAVCEVMNQMMGAASTALSDFLGQMINISTPQTFDLTNLDEFKSKRLPAPTGPIVVVRFSLNIENVLQSEFMNVMPVELARSLVSGFGLGGGDGAHAAAPAPAAPPAPQPAPQPEPQPAGGVMSQDDIAKLLGGLTGQPAEEEDSGGALTQEEMDRLMGRADDDAAAAQTPPTVAAQPQAEAPTPEPTPPPAAAAQTPPPYGMPQMPGQMPPYPPYGMPQMPYPMPEGYPGQMPPYPMYYMPPGWPPYPQEPPKKEPEQPKVISTQPVSMPPLSGAPLSQEQEQNLDLLMAIPLEVTVEIGRTNRKVQDILAFSKGSLVVLDKLAGDQVDLFVNGKCIARGDVVVIDDNFGIRISEILQKPDLADITKG